MSESILEQIAVWHLAMISSITVAAGYQETLVGSRSEEEFLDGDTLRDLSVLCALSAGDGAVVKDCETLDVVAPVTAWWQRFDAFVYVLGRGSTALAVDNRLTRIVADVHKRLGVEMAAHADTDGPYCDGLADALELLPWEIGVSADGVCTVVNVPVWIKYRVLTRDPYSQP
jgi:hypothetical protein